MTQVPEPNGIRESSFGFLIQTLARRIDADMKERLKEHGVDLKIFANLMFLSAKDGITQREIGNELNFPDYYTSRNVDALIQEGFAERRPDPKSRRTTLIFLTPKGRKKAAELPKVIWASNEKSLARLSANERNQVMHLLKKAAGMG
ncbi:MarR family winged helix-turn-helix transcriptional regulator [Aliiroseovarius sp. S1339]|uniref:MarR family winged helix-turn-helix transcriptional regulator n=1 Tax=Aliiroseovarius sp. S1339 TaxID=2936990 RepID=UPI0020BD4A9E|nr:MarR family winged helix-turn-helix transcriptional regulator [Aliiroseovarius sp. S1339]MCK8464588.1 MarR family winged helix-turn-helix transcriptional regulator [Aliiroseovarius sp. S1339]